MADSLIRLKQLNTKDLTGFVRQSLPMLLSEAGAAFSGHVVPNNSSIYNLGSSSNYWKELFTNQISVPSGSGIYFGNTFLNIVLTPSEAKIHLGGYTISSSPNGISI